MNHSRTMLATEVSYLESDFKRSVVTSDPARFARQIADKSYHYLFEVTGFVDFIQWISPAPRHDEQGIRMTLHHIYRPIADFVMAAMQVTQLFSVRLAILTLAMPVFLLFSLHPMFVVLPFAMLFALSVAVTASTFKKYL